MDQEPAVGPPPRLILAIPDQWPRALLRAELRERGYDAIGVRDLVDALGIPDSDPGRGPVRLVLADQSALAMPEDPALIRLLARPDPPALLLLAPGTAPLPGGWDRVIRRPASIGEIADTVQAALPLPPAARRPLG